MATFKQRISEKKDFRVKEQYYWILLCSVVIIYIAVMTFFSYLRYANFLTNNWDLGINEQLLWTNTHGFLMFETGDYETTGVHSFLQVHSSYIAFPISLVYAYYPHVITLFLIQSAAIGSSAFPIYMISKLIGKDSRRAFLMALLFIMNFSTVSALFYSFHFEAFIPLEFFSLLYFMIKRSYYTASIIIAIGTFTLEVFPFLAIGVVFYFAYSMFGLKFINIFNYRRNKSWRILLYILLLSILLYLIVRVVQFVLIPSYLNITNSNNIAAVGSSVLYLFSSSVSLGSFPLSVSYWFLLYFSLSFIPVIYFRKHLIIAFPWMFASIVIYPGFSSYFGDQYSLIALPTVFTGLLLGFDNKVKNETTENESFLLRITIIFSVLFLFVSVIPMFAKIFLEPPIEIQVTILAIVVCVAIFISYLKVKRISILKILNVRQILNIGNESNLSKFAIILILTILLIGNISISPINTANFDSTPMPGYQLHYGINPSYKYISSFRQNISQNSTVVASEILFPYIANNPNAYSLLWYKSNYTESAPFFPFNNTHLPDYVFINSYSANLIPNFLLNALFNESVYGIVDQTYYTNYPGSIYLFKLNYTGNVKTYTISKQKAYDLLTVYDLSLGQDGQRVKFSDSNSGAVITNKEYSSGNIWYGPYSSLMPGNYTVTFNLHLAGNFNSSSGLILEGSALSGELKIFSRNITEISSNTFWNNVSVSFALNFSYPDMEFRGFTYSTYGLSSLKVMLNYIVIRNNRVY